MKSINNNVLKAKLVTFAAKVGNLVSFRELDIANLASGDFELVIVSNSSIQHIMIFDYTLKLIKYNVVGDVSKLGFASFERVQKVITKAKDLHSVYLP